MECPPAPDGLDLGEGTGCVSVAEGDVDPDVLIVYARLDEDGYPEAWRIRLDDGGSDPLDQRLPAGSATSYPRAVGGADVDGDQRDEWFVKVLNLAGHGATWGVLNLFVLEDRFRAVTFEGEPMPLYVGGISRTGEGISCAEGRLVQLRAEARNRQNTNWDTSMRYFVIEEGNARFEKREEAILRLSDYNDPDLDPFYEVNCHGLHYEV